MKWAVGLIITDWYCNGFFGKDNSLQGGTIIHAGKDYLVVRNTRGEVISAWFDNRFTSKDVENYVREWTE